MYASLPMEMFRNIQKSPLFDKMQKDCKAEGIEIPKTIMAKDPVTQCVNPTGIFMKCGSRDNASDEHSSNDEGNGRKCDCEQPDQVFDDGVSGYRTSDPAHYATTTKMQVNSRSITN